MMMTALTGWQDVRYHVPSVSTHEMVSRAGRGMQMDKLLFAPKCLWSSHTSTSVRRWRTGNGSGNLSLHLDPRCTTIDEQAGQRKNQRLPLSQRLQHLITLNIPHKCLHGSPSSVARVCDSSEGVKVVEHAFRLNELGSVNNFLARPFQVGS
ncbi:hypothetical protein Scep_025199 [Stephania cephalantha]|uniref:Uncharacterized protein n=1 Tax=Stephania cephalantha TaxID=152367 RepID=A0AAP0EHT2_9MAGN